MNPIELRTSSSEAIQENLLLSLRHICSQTGLDHTYWIAYSGGLDSHVLLFLCDLLRTHLAIKLRAIHLNHGLSPHAWTWATHCQKICAEKNIDFIEHTIQLDLNSGDSLEEIAREKRYAFFAECMDKNDVLLTAHHQEDQAETVLLQLLRGAGVKGLAAMPMIKTFAQGLHYRPFLPFSRVMLEQVAKQHQLNWINDESNNNTQFSRNYIRHHILPALKSRWPAAAMTIARSAMHCSESQALLEEFILELYVKTHGSDAHTLSVAKLKQYRSEKQRLVLRAWISKLGYPLPNLKKIEAIQKNVLTAAWDRKPCVKWKDTEIRRYRDDLYLMRSLPDHPEQSHQWDFTHSLILPGLGLLHSSITLGKGLRFDLNTVSVRFRQGGEKIEMPGRGTHTLKNLLQAWNVLPWERNRLPLIFLEDRLIGVAGYFIHNEFAAKSTEMGREIWLEKKGGY